MSHWLDGVARILSSNCDGLKELALLTTKDPSNFYCGANLDDLDLSGEDLLGLNFDQANLSYVVIDGFTQSDCPHFIRETLSEIPFSRIKDHSLVEFFTFKDKELSGIANNFQIVQFREYLLENFFNFEKGNKLERKDVYILFFDKTFDTHRVIYYFVSLKDRYVSYAGIFDSKSRKMENYIQRWSNQIDESIKALYMFYFIHRLGSFEFSKLYNSEDVRIIRDSLEDFETHFRGFEFIDEFKKVLRINTNEVSGFIEKEKQAME